VPVSETDLLDGVGQALGHPVASMVRRPWPYASSAPLEELTIPGCPRMLFKDLSPRCRASRPAFVADPLREIEMYTSLLDGLDAPACHGVVVMPNRVWLFIEVVEGEPLWQAEGLAAWTAAARWLARLHSSPIPNGRRLLRRDAAHLRRWIDRAVAMAPRDALAGVDAAAGRAIDLLGAWPPAFIHGEMYCSNAIVQRGRREPRIRPVDWEMAGIGPGLLDLAALISGRWDAASRARIVAAYRTALPQSPDGFAATLDAARLLVALQWLGWSRRWTPPREHRHDWAAEARRLAARIAP
jgi:aminoglycoside phosphotransferase (APT) family kinase protein